MDRIELVPRYEGQGYSEEQIAARRAWVEARRGVSLPLLGSAGVEGEALRGNIENPIGMAQVPVGLAGPLLVKGEHLEEVVYVPLATTEGAMVRSYERGMVAITRSGGAVARVLRDENRVTPVFLCRDGAAAADFARWLPGELAALRREAEATTGHGRLLRVEPIANGLQVLVHFVYSTGDAHGMNMIVKATEAACRWIEASGRIERHLILSGASGEKRPAGALFAGGKGKTVTASVRLPRRVLRAALRVTARQMEELWRLTEIGRAHV